MVCLASGCFSDEYFVVVKWVGLGGGGGMRETERCFDFGSFLACLKQGRKGEQ